LPRPLRWYDYITINIYFLGLTILSQTLTPLVVPLLVQQFVGDASKGAFYGTLRLWTLMAAVLMQALMGMLSDRSTLPWGRRRPFIFIGTVIDLGIVAAIAFAGHLSGMTGYWFLFAMVLLLSFSSNTAQGPQQALIPDLVPEGQRGKFSGVKAIFEIPLPLIIVSFTIARMISRGNMLGGMLVAAGVLLLSMVLAMFVPEQRLRQAPPFDWEPFGRLVLMTALFTAIILGMGAAVTLVGRLMDGVTSVPALVLGMGGVGLIGMAVAVALGVVASVRVSIGGQAAQRNSSFTWWVVNRLAYLVGVGNLSSFAVYFIQARLGLARERAAAPASLLMLIVGVFILACALPGGWLADRFGRKRLVAFSGLLATLGTLIAILAGGLPAIYLGGSLIGIATGLFYTANWALGADLVPKEEAGRYLGISNLAGAGAGAIGAYIGGPIADYFTAHAPGVPGLGYLVIFAIYGALFLLSVAALMKVHEPGRAAAGAVQMA
jgi:MFS family permease